MINLLCVKDLSSTHLNKSSAGTGGGGYRAPGGPMTSPPVYRTHGGDLSPKSFTPTSPTIKRFPSSPAGGSEKHLDPELLVNKTPSDLPDGIDPSQREVGVEKQI